MDVYHAEKYWLMVYCNILTVWLLVFIFDHLIFIALRGDR